MVIFTGLFTAFGRLIGAVASMMVAWAAMMLFGRATQARQTLLSFIALGSVLWVLAIAGVFIPAVGNLIVSAVPRTSLIEFSWITWTMLALAAFLPLAVGLATVPLLPEEARSMGRILGQGLLGYPYAVVFAAAIFFLGLWGLVRQIHSLRTKWDSAHIPLIVKSGRYDDVVGDIENALHDAGFNVSRTPAAPWLAVPTGLLAALGGRTVKRQVPDGLVEFRVHDLEILVYPFDVALLGRQELVARARAAIARRLVTADAYLTPARESQDVEDRVAEISRRARVSDGEFEAIDELLDSLVMPYDQWETLYWQRLQAQQPAEPAADHQVVEGGARAAARPIPADGATANR
jgi:hypothetical protein